MTLLIQKSFYRGELAGVDLFYSLTVEFGQDMYHCYISDDDSWNERPLRKLPVVMDQTYPVTFAKANDESYGHENNGKERVDEQTP